MIAAAPALIATPAFAASAQEAAPRPQAVTVVAAHTGEVIERIGLTGTLVPREEVLISPQISDIAITEILVEEGDPVLAGDVMARLSRDQLDTSMAQNAAATARAQASIAQAQAAVVEAAAAKTQADLALTRSRDLAGRGDASRETLEQRQAAADTTGARLEANRDLLLAATADLAMAQAQRRELDVRLDHTEIRAPVDGIVSRRTARLGQVVQGTGEPLFRLIAGGTIELEAEVPEMLLARLAAGQSVEIDTASGNRTGHVRLISPEVSRSSRLGRVRISVDGDAPLVIGSFARASVEVARRTGILVPLSSILFQPSGPVVQVVHGGTVETRSVRIGLQADGQAEISAGLQAGEEVVAISGTFIRDGDRVTAVPRS